MLSSLIFLGISMTCYSQNVGINSTGAAPADASILDIVSTTQGVLMPRMSTAQRDAIASPATGLQIYNTDADNFNYYNGTGWVPMNSSGGTIPGNAGTITGASTVTQGQTGVSYSVSAIATATGYTWSFTGTGFSIATGANTNSITANFSASAISGNLLVFGTNVYGNGGNSPIFAITVNP